MTHRCCICGSDNCMCPPEKEENKAASLGSSISNGGRARGMTLPVGCVLKLLKHGRGVLHLPQSTSEPIAVGHRFYVMEPFRLPSILDGSSPPKQRCPIYYVADERKLYSDGNTVEWGCVRKMNEMSEWASRMDVQVTSIRRERLKDISISDLSFELADQGLCFEDDHLERYCELWDGKYGDAKGLLSSDNPTVLRVQYKIKYTSITRDAKGDTFVDAVEPQPLIPSPRPLFYSGLVTELRKTAEEAKRVTDVAIKERIADHVSSEMMTCAKGGLSYTSVRLDALMRHVTKWFGNLAQNIPTLVREVFDELRKLPGVTVIEVQPDTPSSRRLNDKDLDTYFTIHWTKEESNA